jgi:hypothetical protein
MLGMSGSKGDDVFSPQVSAWCSAREEGLKRKLSLRNMPCSTCLFTLEKEAIKRKTDFDLQCV